VVIAVAIGVGLTRNNASQPQSQRLSVGATAPDGSFTAINGQANTIASLRGQPALVWFVTTYCDSCAAGTQAMAGKIDQFAQHHVKVVQLELAGNLGGDGPDIATFGRQIAGDRFNDPNWIWGTASQSLTNSYDPKALLDVYYLLDTQGHVTYINGSPEATMGSLLEHVRALGT
jgi:cytochrome oxidase Cu insertion factor (SCO1/SenC/PrrC family)